MPTISSGNWPCAHGGQLGVHVRQVLLDRPALHPAAHDVEECEDARAGLVDHLALELRKIAPSRAARVHDRRDPRAEGEAVGRDRRGPVAVGRVRFGAVEDVGMDVDQPRHDVQTLCVDGLRRAPWCDPGFDGRDLPAGDGDVADPVDPVLRVDDVTAPDQQVEFGRLLRPCGRGTRENDGQGGQQGSYGNGHRRFLLMESRLSEVACPEQRVSGSRRHPRAGRRCRSGPRPPVRPAG